MQTEFPRSGIFPGSGMNTPSSSGPNIVVKFPKGFLMAEVLSYIDYLTSKQQ